MYKCIYIYTYGDAWPLCEKPVRPDPIGKPVTIMLYTRSP